MKVQLRAEWTSYYNNKLVASLFFLLTLSHPLAWGQNETGSTSPESSRPPDLELPSLWLVSLQMLFWLLIVVLLIFISIWFMKKLMLPGKQLNSQKPINLLFQEPIGPGRSICLVRILGQVHVIGITNSQISYLSTLEDHEIELLNQWLENDFLLEHRLKTGFQSFFQRLNRKVGK